MKDRNHYRSDKLPGHHGNLTPMSVEVVKIIDKHHGVKKIFPGPKVGGSHNWQIRITMTIKKKQVSLVLCIQGSRKKQKLTLEVTKGYERQVLNHLIERCQRKMKGTKITQPPPLPD